ncbi:acyl-CoA thioesterase/BAAT N-terminal domain-containing protein [Alkalihalophilus marmarensis]|uniref:acyl-CoA thioesterase/BAAT N-terminal domain-containing protein n=1 Tax=Alkalihalophilus marmarensis TaxID=521377 RepID=UPI0004148358|nr:acyl-CoA thioesterase/BAAT N-terminal domain-containing protein [Alkalihalophilus marmarensis]MCM3489277.1 acyl-CoA thioesterase/BAAT N-terminal domain-containing protein [Alkalihalophilus marmarensis]
MPQPSLFISKTVSYIDEKLTIKVINCPANQEFTIRVLADDDQGKNFASYAVFQADEKGEVEVSHTIPIQGTYSSADASGLFWSVERTDADRVIISRRRQPPLLLLCFS